MLDTPTLTIPVDTEHSALRLSVIGIFLLSLVIGFILFNNLIGSDGFNIMAGVIAFLLAALITRQTETLLKKRWPSGRAIQWVADGVRLLKKDVVEKRIKAAEPTSILLWSFQIKRRTRVPKGWFVMACALEQDEVYLTVYSLVSPDQANVLNALAKFTFLLPSTAQNKKSGVRQDSLRIAGEQRRLHVAESHRWNDGAEMTFADFEQFITRLNGSFAQWMPVNK